MKKSKKVLLITFIVALFIAGKIIIGNMVRNVQNISVSMPDLSSVQDGNYIDEPELFTAVQAHIKSAVVTIAATPDPPLCYRIA